MKKEEFALYLKNLETRFGPFKQKDEALLSGPLKMISPRSFLNRVFLPKPAEKIDEYERLLKASFPREFKEFLLHTNGASFFFNSLCIAGLQNDPPFLHEPLDLFKENYFIRLENSKFIDYLVFGYIGVRKVLAFPLLDGRDSVFVLNRDTLEVLKLYIDFDSFLRLYIDGYAEQYGPDLRKIGMAKNDNRPGAFITEDLL